MRRSDAPATRFAEPSASRALPSAPVDGKAFSTRKALHNAGFSLRSTAFVITAGAALYLVEGDVLRYLALIIAAAAVLLLTTNAHAAAAGRPQPALIARISKQVFGPRWRVAACIAHYESTDGAHLYNGPNLGPWQINVAAHPWVNAWRVVTDWWYSARVAYRISDGGRDWSAWSTRGNCGA